MLDSEFFVTRKSYAPVGYPGSLTSSCEIALTAFTDPTLGGNYEPPKGLNHNSTAEPCALWYHLRPHRLLDAGNVEACAAYGVQDGNYPTGKRKIRLQGDRG